MKKADVVGFFGGPYATGKALGISGQAVSKWEDEVPSSRLAHVELAMRVEQERREDEARKEARRYARKAKQES
jgi:hypothetical protein